MTYQIQTLAIILVAGLSYSAPVQASRCMKSAEKQAVSILKKSGHSMTSQTKHTYRINYNEELKRVYSLTPAQELYSTEIWEDENNFAVYDVVVDTETCRLKMVRAGGI